MLHTRAENFPLPVLWWEPTAGAECMNKAILLVTWMSLCGLSFAKHKPEDFPGEISILSEQLVPVTTTENKCRSGSQTDHHSDPITIHDTDGNISHGTIDYDQTTTTTTCGPVTTTVYYEMFSAKDVTGHQNLSLMQLNWFGNLKPIGFGRHIDPGTYRYRWVGGGFLEILRGNKVLKFSASASLLTTTPQSTPRATPATVAQSNRTVLLMGADNDTIVTSFAVENACADLHEVRLFEKGGPLFDWSLAVVGHQGHFEVALIDRVNKQVTFLGTGYREGTRKACYIIRGLTNAKWEPIETQ